MAKSKTAPGRKAAFSLPSRRHDDLEDVAGSIQAGSGKYGLGVVEAGMKRGIGSGLRLSTALYSTGLIGGASGGV